VLARGFVLVTLPDGRIAKRVADAAGAAAFDLLFADGRLAAHPAGGAPPSPPRKAGAPRHDEPLAPPPQGRLL